MTAFSPGNIALVVTFLMIVVNAFGLTITEADVRTVVTWAANGVGVITIIVGFVRHLLAKKDVVVLSNQLVSAGKSPLRGPMKGTAPTEDARVKANTKLSAIRMVLAFLMIGVMTVLVACATPAGAPPQSPREVADPILITYGAVLVLANTAVYSPAIQAKPDIKNQIKASSHAATDAVLAYSHAASLCWRNPNTNEVVDAIGNAPGEHCDPTGLSGASAAAMAALTNLQALLAAFGFTPPKTSELLDGMRDFVRLAASAG